MTKLSAGFCIFQIMNFKSESHPGINLPAVQSGRVGRAHLCNHLAGLLLGGGFELKSPRWNCVSDASAVQCEGTFGCWKGVAVIGKRTLAPEGTGVTLLCILVHFFFLVDLISFT